MAGTIPLSMTQQFDEYGNPLAGGKLYLIEAGTVSTPQNGYQDYDLSIALPNPITLDAAGRIPQFFLADGYIKIRLQNAAGVTQLSADYVLVVGPSTGGGGGGGTVDPTTIMETGDIKYRYGTVDLDGFVRCNGRTIGSISSGATERANADCEVLFLYLWNVDENLDVSGGRGANAASDWGADKAIALPDARGRVLAGLDGMGNTEAGNLSEEFFEGETDTLGSKSNDDANVLVTDNLPPYTPSGSVSNGAITINGQGSVLKSSGLTSTAGAGTGLTGTLTGSPLTASQDTSTFTGDDQGGISAPFSIIQPTMVITIYIKL